MAKIFHHIFFLKKTKNYVKGPVTVYLRITISGKRAEISTNKKVDPRKWLSNPGRMRGNDEDVKRFNLDLLSIEGKLCDAYNAIRNEGIPTATALKNRYTGADEKQRMLVVPIFQNHNREMPGMIFFFVLFANAQTIQPLSTSRISERLSGFVWLTAAHHRPFCQIQSQD